jgi:transcriptional regulator with GAF, ATPase, and Fis domain
MGVWHYFHARNHAMLKKPVLDTLAQANVNTYAFDPIDPKGPGVLFFDEVTPQFCEFLSEASRFGLERVLAVAISRHALSNGDCWRLLQHGASDVFAWERPADPGLEVAARFKRWEMVDGLMRSPVVRDNLIGQSPAWIRALRQVVEVARFTNAPVLITGESGTGKELVARLIHTLDPRQNKRDLVVLDGASVVPELSGSEFFGHERGSFTGAVAAREGAFTLADGGTLFLDEVGELPMNLQAELLRVMQEHTYKRVGSNNWQRTDFRLISATNRDLLAEEARGYFRRDFYYRIAGWVCHLPPMRDRVEDVLPLARHYLEKLSPEDPPELDDAVREYLLSRDYPGNVRDLKHLVTRIFYHHVGPGPITVGDIPENERPASGIEAVDWRDQSFYHAIRRALAQSVGLKEIGRAAEDAAERIAIEDEQGNLQRAAYRLGVTDRALQMRRAARRQNGFAPNLSQKR